MGEESCRHWHMPVFSEVRWRVRTHERRAAAARVPRPRESSRGIVTRGMQRGPRAQAIANRREHSPSPRRSIQMNHTWINTPTTASLAALALPGRRFAGLINRTRRRGRRVAYVTPGCFAHPKSRAFWLGGVSEGGQLSEDRRAQGQ